MHLSDSEILMYAEKQTSGFVVIDTETTGLDPEKDEVLSLAVVDEDGKELFYHYIKPGTRKRWPKATEINGITWKDVKDEKELWEYRDELNAIFAKYNLLVGYNLEFDLEMLEASGYKVPIARTFDLMHAYSDAYGRWSEKHGDYTWVKLTQCAKHYKYKFEAHDALNDAMATAYCYKAFVAECQKEKDAKGEGYWKERERAAEERAKRAHSEEAAKQKEEKERSKSRNVGCAAAYFATIAILFILAVFVIRGFFSGLFIMLFSCVVVFGAIALYKTWGR